MTTKQTTHLSRLGKPVLIALALTAAVPALAAPNGNNQGRGWGVGQIPPGHQYKAQKQAQNQYRHRHQYRHRTGDTLPDGYVILSDYAPYRLPDPGQNRYAISGDTIYKIARDAAVVVSAMGIYNNLTAN
ncbi:hypothetical protein [Celeribacter neptunius]|uniref:Regulator RcnB of Ni and Co efflux n=1 Tax=Celeribacter neptunius TaxID=588602 RepID=A0A1I3IKC7_9RHOB|nr:hypothetical protein [Celeribacter neptunius]SFI48267.1 hypothetical protein SAMN04487991_0041 [Celeribacter neptunius]